MKKRARIKVNSEDGIKKEPEDLHNLPIQISGLHHCEFPKVLTNIAKLYFRF